MAGGRLREVVAHGGLTVFKLMAATRPECARGLDRLGAGTCSARPELMRSDLLE